MITGQRFGDFEVSAVLGRGGMGEVWRAIDTRLGREVALKVLPADFADDPERHARFEREARTLASLNHPHIATLYGLEHLDGQHVLVMELVEGEGLDQLIARGPVPVDEAILIALQIAEALEAAHEAGIVHRDLKPANIRLRPDGAVKVLDFGLAKSWEAGNNDSSLSMSPTMTRHATAAGVILGTAAYMSPEQARGKPVDRRADIWAFGVVLWEMLTGARLFSGETVSDVLAAVLTRPPGLGELPRDTPPAVIRTLSRCLTRDPRKRLQWIGDARLELEDTAGSTESAPVASAAVGTRRTPWVVASGLAVIAIVATTAALRSSTPTTRRVAFTIPAPAGSVFHLEGLGPGPVALSPDGGRVAFTLRDHAGTVRICIRSLDAVELACLEGSDGAQYPFWSPDGSELGFFTRSGASLKVIPASGGAARTLCVARNGKGGSWNREGTIVFTPDSNTPLFAVSDAGGEPRPVTSLDATRGDNSHRHPWFLPDGRRFLFLARNVGGSDANTLRVGSLDGGADREIMRSPVAAQLVAGRMLFMRDRTLLARPFDDDRLEFSGPALQIAEDLVTITGAARGLFTATADVLCTQHGEDLSRSELVWLDRSGARLGRLGDVASYFSLSVSPDGRRVAAPVTNDTTGTHDLWIYDVERNLRSRVTFHDAEDMAPAWSPDSREIYFSSNRGGPFAVYRLTPGESAEPELIAADEGSLMTSSVAPDGSRLLLVREDTDTGSDLMMVELGAGGKPELFRATRYDEEHPSFSPDGRWVAYTSNESGQPEVYVTTSSPNGRHWQVSANGGIWPRWIAGTGELLYQEPSGRFVVVPVRTVGAEIELGTPTTLFEGIPGTRLYQHFDPSPDGSRILARALSSEGGPDHPIVTVDWLEKRGSR